MLDLGCGNGSKLAELVGEGAGHSVGVDISGNFLSPRPAGLELIQGDMSALDSVAELRDRTFDRILFLQSFGYAEDPVRVLRAARALLAPDGFILLSRTQPIRYAVERAEKNGTSLGFKHRHEPVGDRRQAWIIGVPVDHLDEVDVPRRDCRVHAFDPAMRSGPANPQIHISQFMLNPRRRTSFFAAIADRLRPGGVLVSADLAAPPKFDTLVRAD